ncbi:hypothetical protein TNCV_1077381 [Trichonephila clavipes]|uniref:Uncharacterized protein n=1 Tax=Trichonephila clavipes TaxID=2585209 RepID=A0A8X6V741_TRICX|nr:hypothetical protein TNCV_1077381 [Trichonephila clavipes]
MKASSIFSPGEDSMKITLSASFQLITGTNTPPFLWVPTTPVFSSTISGISYWMQSKECTRLDAGCKEQSLLYGCRLFTWKFFQTHSSKFPSRLRSRQCHRALYLK